MLVLRESPLIDHRSARRREFRPYCTLSLKSLCNLLPTAGIEDSNLVLETVPCLIRPPFLDDRREHSLQFRFDIIHTLLEQGAQDVALALIQ